MSEFVTYVLFSEKHNKHYTGFTSDLINRFRSHNEYGTSGFTKRYRPWKVVYVVFFDTKEEAMSHEKYLKMGKGREWLKELGI